MGSVKKHSLYKANKIVIYDDHAEIVLRHAGRNDSRALISLDKIEMVKGIRWHVNDMKRGYVSTKYPKKIYLHRLLLSAGEHQVVDHINHNTLDNRNENLRLCTHSQNLMNQVTPADNTSGRKGVSWNKGRRKWEAYISISSKTIKLGRHRDFCSACEAREKAEEKYFGEYRNLLNFEKTGEGT